MSINQYDATNDKLSKVAGLYAKTENINAKDVYLESGESVEDAIDKIQVVTGTLSSTLNDPIYISYPTGFNNTNCLIIGAMFDKGSDTWSEQTANNITRFDASIMSAGISAIPRSDDAKGRPVKVVLLKTS